MKAKDYIDLLLEGEEFIDQVSQINNNNYTSISNDVWEVVQDEGIDEEWKVGKNDLEYTQLNLSKDDIEGLKNFDDDIVNKWNRFDIMLKDRFKNYVDFIDYDNGIVRIIRKK